MKASRSLRLMMLSSTMSTFMGGTAPFSIPAGTGWSVVAEAFFFLRCVGRGEETRGGGAGSGGGVGIGDAAEGMVVVGFSERVS